MSVKINKESIVIENGFIAKEFFVSGSKIVSTRITNRRSFQTVEFPEGSNEFILCFKGLLGGEYVKSEELKIGNSYSENSVGKDKLIIEFKPFKIKGCKISLKLVHEMGDFDFFMRKYLIFEYDCSKGDKVVLDSVDLDPFVIADRSAAWSLPEQNKSHISAFALSLGQPVFYQSLFFGCEFPAALNTIENDRMSVKRYYGKDLNSLCGSSGRFATDRSVCGVAPLCTYNSVRAAFFEYIDRISKKNTVRIQFNSWYDNMLDISRDNIYKSFIEIEKGLNSVGMEPLDSFVVDDGWNDYTSDFWRFNEKFPDELHSPSALVENLGSTFGLWLGPRGGYTRSTVKFARQIEASGNGYVNKKAFDICVASSKYVNKVSDLMLDYQERFNLDYWKLDGFAYKPCTSKEHDHEIGGKNNMYYYSDLWEKWINVFERLNRAKKKPPFINLTCYAPPSPWFLQWVNSVWLQCSDDMGLCKKFKDGRRECGGMKDRALTYRDGRYYEFYNERQFCFPPYGLYNHEPIYAERSGLKMSDNEFRDYMFMNAARGTQFIELYFSAHMMSEAKWRITDAAVRFAKENAEILKKTVMIGGDPTAGQIYGYSAFNENEGFITLRNPDSKEKDFVFVLDEKTGVSDFLNNVSVCSVLPGGSMMPGETYSYKDTFRVVLKPYQTVIYHFGRKPKKLECLYKQAKDNKILEVKFNQSVRLDSVSCNQNPIESSVLLEDERTALINFRYDFADNNTVVLDGICDLLGNKSTVELSFMYYENYLIRVNGIVADGDFTVKIKRETDEEAALYTQGKLKICVKNRKVIFSVGNTAICSDSSADGVTDIAAVREKNGMLKLYLNGKLDKGCKVIGKPYYIENVVALTSSGCKVKLYSRALGFDEIID